MDFESAAFLLVVLTGLSQLVKKLVFGTPQERKIALTVLATCVATVMMVGESAWGNDNLVAGHSLGALDIISRLLVAVVLTGGATTIWEGLGDVSNIGENFRKVQVNIPQTENVTIER